MNVLNNKGVKPFLLGLVLILTVGQLVWGMLAYRQAAVVQGMFTERDAELAGRIRSVSPGLSAAEIAALFTSAPRAEDAESGRTILADAGYNGGTDMRLLPSIWTSYRSYAWINGLACTFFGALVLLTVYRFLKRLYGTVDQYQEEVYYIMNGGRTTWIDDTEEGSLSRLAAAINTMISSLQTHIAKEKQNRLFLKETMTNISHQLKTPLSALFMYNEIMQGEAVNNETVSRFLEKSGQELERMQRLITNLLKMARLDAGIIELHKRPVMLNELIRRAAGSLETRLEREGKRLDMEAVRPVSYACDPEWLLEAVSNLLTNAVEHSGPGSSITVQLTETPLLVDIVVADGGEGVHPDDANFLFKPFYRSRFSQNKQGTGIGLTLAKAIAEMHGGFISLDSKPGQGAKFTLHLPRLTKL